MINTNEPVRKNANILIVDDIPDNLKVLGSILKEEGYKVRPVLNGELALQVAEKEKPDLIILDIMMPGMDGYEICSQLKENPGLKDIPVIFISALNDTNDIIKAFNVGGVDYITKPFRGEEVKARVATHLKIKWQSEELKDLLTTKDKFFSIIAHDLRGPIGNMLLISESISGKGQVDEDTLYLFLEMQKELSKDTFQLLENLLNWARSNTNQIEFKPEVLDAASILKEIAETHKIQAFSKNISVNILIPEFCTVYADENMFKSIVRNLISNALKFTPQGGRIDAAIQTEADNSVSVKVKDSGIGIPAELLENLFRINVNTKREGTDGETSNGLGLLLCHEFVKKHGGTISVVSEEGAGSEFTVQIPAKSGSC